MYCLIIFIQLLLLIIQQCVCVEDSIPMVCNVCVCFKSGLTDRWCLVFVCTHACISLCLHCLFTCSTVKKSGLAVVGVIFFLEVQMCLVKYIVKSWFRTGRECEGISLVVSVCVDCV